MRNRNHLSPHFSDYIFNASIILIVPDRYTDQQMVGDGYYFAAMIHYFTVCHQHFTVYFLEKGLFFSKIALSHYCLYQNVLQINLKLLGIFSGIQSTKCSLFHSLIFEKVKC